MDASTVSSMCQDKEGDLWINNRSLIRFNPYTEVFHLYNTHNGLHSMMGINQRIIADADLNIYLTKFEGIEWINKREEDQRISRINLVTEGLEINGDRMLLGYGKHRVQILNLSASQNNLTFFFSAISFDDVADIRYIYKLEGFDRSWNPCENLREARYTNLPPGTYTFTFNVLNHPGYRNAENQLMVIIHPFLWQRWWFITSALLFLGSLIYLGYRIRINQLLKVERLRSRIASDLHDDVGSTLSSVSILSDLLDRQVGEGNPRRMLDSIRNSSRQMMEKLDDIVWVVSPSNDQFRDLGLRLSEYAIPLCETKGIRFEFELDECLSQSRLSVEIRRNLFLIAKEAINNAVKYAGCSRIVISFMMHNQFLTMSMTDNGKGFDPEAPTSRNGVRNMKLRAIAMGSLLEIQSTHGTGTTVSCRVRMKGLFLRTP
jgi:signal transduction histidine kinase